MRWERPWSTGLFASHVSHKLHSLQCPHCVFMCSNGLKWHSEWVGKYGKNLSDMYKNMYRLAGNASLS